jgi:nitronate monooxygenase
MEHWRGCAITIPAMTTLPKIIQGGMGAGVSGWRLANAVSREGHLGVVAGTALDVILARKLQLGDPGEHLRRALREFPIPGIAKRILDRYFVEGGKEEDSTFKGKPILSETPSRALTELTVVANFVEVFLAREGHENAVGINYLEKIQLPTLPSLFGAMLAGAGYVCMGAGIPLAIPGILDRLAQGLSVELTLDVVGAERGETFRTHFDPVDFAGGEAPLLERPRFLAIVSTDVVANVLLRKASGTIDGFVIEGATAGGHNAPPRGRAGLSPEGEPVYGPRDVPKLEAFRSFGLPFWLAGGCAEPEQLEKALAEGAAGIQVGTAFAFTEESAIAQAWKEKIIGSSRAGKAHVFTDPIASPTGFPFKVIEVEGTLSDPVVNAARQRVCDLGYLRHAYRREDASIGWRCSSEPIDDFVKKGGEIAATEGRKCVCNGLLTNIGLGQLRPGRDPEVPIFTSGDDLANIARFIPSGSETYHAADVIEYLMAPARQS